MAGEPQPSSEYKSQFKWQLANRNKPLPDKKAGCMSAEMGICAEPPFVRRKKSPERSYHTSIARYFQPDDSRTQKSFKKVGAEPAIRKNVAAAEAKVKEVVHERGRKSTRTSKECRKKVPLSEYESKYPLPWMVRVQTKVNETSVEPSLGQDYWYLQVVELRRKADEYKKRARGVNFSREHLAQLIAPRAELWDLSSCSGSLYQKKSYNRRGLFQASEENLRTEGKEEIYINPRSHSSPPGSHVQRETNLGIDSQQLRPKEKQLDSSQTKRKLAWTETEPMSLNLDGVDEKLQIDTSSGPENDEDSGRIPTPELIVQEKSVRHHLDRTTPMTGSLLLSPTHTKNTVKKMVDNRRSKSLPRTSSYIIGRDPSPSKTVRSLPHQTHRSSQAKVKSQPVTGVIKDDICDCAVIKGKEPRDSAVKLGKPLSTPRQHPHSVQVNKTVVNDIGSCKSLANEILQRASTRHKEFLGKNI